MLMRIALFGFVSSFGMGRSCSDLLSEISVIVELLTAFFITYLGRSPGVFAIIANYYFSLLKELEASRNC